MKTLFFDVDTQIDFLFPAGALYVPGAESIVERVVRLNRYAAVRNIPVISTVDAHSEDDPEFRAWPHHCVVHSTGQQKPAAALLEKRLLMSSSVTPLPSGGPPQILLEKQTFDCFTNPNLVPLLQQFGVERYVVYGVVTEICVKMALDGLLKYAGGKKIELVTDAVCSLNTAAADAIIAGFVSAGGVLTTVAEVTR